ncbi:hypothetical protein KP509_28G023800 [Ceratopteris richardii]|uniref:Uncharacterized protein n=1 Tax=Ceratopteris richardii TaxID=49495 RepID=A0A8T2RCX4_CERRI|nr:hypothetical protein KP509_28G023800 [Ceratopteris richardii]
MSLATYELKNYLLYGIFYWETTHGSLRPPSGNHPSKAYCKVGQPPTMKTSIIWATTHLGLVARLGNHPPSRTPLYGRPPLLGLLQGWVTTHHEDLPYMGKHPS